MHTSPLSHHTCYVDHLTEGTAAQSLGGGKGSSNIMIQQILLLLVMDKIVLNDSASITTDLDHDEDYAYNEILSSNDKKSARICRTKKLLFSIVDKKCYEPLSRGPCDNSEWFIAVEGKLGGACGQNLCTSDANPVLFN